MGSFRVEKCPEYKFRKQTNKLKIWVWWAIMLAFRRQRLADFYELKIALVYIVSADQPWLHTKTSSVLVRVSVAVKGHHDHGNFYKEKTFSWI